MEERAGKVTVILTPGGHPRWPESQFAALLGAGVPS